MQASLSPRIVCLLPALLAACAISSGRSNLTHQERIFAARDRVLPALVHIQPVIEVFRAGQRGRVAVTGSGVIFSPDGYILTNTHVVGNASSLTCTLANHDEVEARLVGVDPLSDLAVIKIDMSKGRDGVRHAPLGDSAMVEAGQVVMAMGSPLGLARSLSLGVVSSLDRYFPESLLPTGAPTGTYNTWIQTDAAINPGNSGGPLVSLDGEVIGINARAIPVYGENLGFSIPINLAKEIAAALIARGAIVRSWIGVTWQPIRGLGSHFGVPEDTGAVVGSVVPASPAAGAGLRAGDVVVRLDGETVAALYAEDLPRLQKQIADLTIGRDVAIEYIRGGRQAQARLITRDRPAAEARDRECREWGFTVQAVTEEAAQAMRLPGQKGVLVTGVKQNSFADVSGLRRLDVIEMIEGRTIEGMDDYLKLYQDMIASARQKILLEVRRGRLKTFHVIRPSYDTQQQGAAQEKHP